MFSKYLHWIGLAACITLVVACFLPWAFYADLHENFTGLYSHEYGRPGKLLILLAIIAFTFMLLPKIWAKRANLFVCALCVAYAVKSYTLFASCYNAYCPEKKIGLYLMIISSFVMLIASVFPDLKLGEKKEAVTSPNI